MDTIPQLFSQLNAALEHRLIRHWNIETLRAVSVAMVYFNESTKKAQRIKLAQHIEAKYGVTTLLMDSNSRMRIDIGLR